MISLPYLLKRDDNFYYPIIKIIVKNKNLEFETEALIDSGATMSVFQGSIAEYLSIEIEKGQKRIFQGVGGKIVGYVHEMNIVFLNKEFKCKIAFSNELTTSLNLLGRDNFFEPFLITFDEKNKKMNFEETKYERKEL